MSTINAKRYLQKPYARVLIPDARGGYHAEIIEFPGCYAQGESVEEAYNNLEEAAIEWIQTCIKRKQEIPEPSSNLGYSGNMLFRMPRSVHRRAAQRAAIDRTSLNQYVLAAVSARVGADDFCDMLMNRIRQSFVNLMTITILGKANTPDSVGPTIDAEIISSTGRNPSAGTNDRFMLRT